MCVRVSTHAHDINQIYFISTRFIRVENMLEMLVRLFIAKLNVERAMNFYEPTERVVTRM